MIIEAAPRTPAAVAAGKPNEERPDGDEAEPLQGAARRVLVGSSTDVVDASLRLVTALAAATVENADGVSVTLERHGQLMTVAASDDAVLTMDRHQYETGEGPCLDARALARWFYIESLAEETRWPHFVPLALDQGIHSILSSPLMTGGRAQGALNIYSSTAAAFGTHQQHLAALFAAQASEILTAANHDVSDEETNRRFADALAARQVIHQAQGAIMVSDEVTAERAMGTLIRRARTEGVTLVAHASALVASLRHDGDHR
jgi:GAF domain-containing protein